MRIIDLTGLLISNKTMPKHIIFEEEEYCWDSSANDYICNDHDATQLFNNQYNMSNLPLFLGKTVEILEEEKKIPEKLGLIKYSEDPATSLIHYKVDEIIDYLQYLKSKGE